MKRFSIPSILLVVIFIQLACSLPTGPIGQVETPQPTGTETLAAAITPSPLPSFTPLPPTSTTVPSSISLDTLKNFTYTVIDANTQVTLKNGEFTGDHLHSLFVEPAAFGDLNGDGRPDAAVILATNTGGSGRFYDLIAVLDQNGAPVQAAFASLGDRQGIKNLQIANGRILLDFLTQGLKDPFCCPSEHRFRSYVLDNSALRLASEQVLANPNVQATPLPNEIVIEQPAETLDFLSSPQPIRGRVSQVPPEKKLVYHVTDIDGKPLLQGDVPLAGEPGRPGTFDFEINLGDVKNGIYHVELIDSANGVLRGRSIVVLVPRS